MISTAFYFIRILVDDTLFGKKILTNRYFATVTMFPMALMAGVGGCGHTLHKWFGWDTEVSLIPIIATGIVLWGINLAEVIIASRDLKTLFLNALIKLLLIPVLYVVIYYAAIITMPLLALLVVELVLTGGGGALFTGGGGKKTYMVDENGHKTRVHSFGGGYIDSSGTTYSKGSNGKWHED